MDREAAAPAALKSQRFYNVRGRAQEHAACRAPGRLPRRPTLQRRAGEQSCAGIPGTVVDDSRSDPSGKCAMRPPAAAYFAALAPAAAARPSCWPVPPLAPIAPMILPFTVIGTPPSDATGFSGKVKNAVLPAAY